MAGLKLSLEEDVAYIAANTSVGYGTQIIIMDTNNFSVLGTIDVSALPNNAGKNLDFSLMDPVGMSKDRSILWLMNFPVGMSPEIQEYNLSNPKQPSKN